MRDAGHTHKAVRCRPDGEPTYNEAHIFDGGRMVPATLVDAPWLRRLQPFGEDVAVGVAHR